MWNMALLPGNTNQITTDGVHDENLVVSEAPAQMLTKYCSAWVSPRRNWSRLTVMKVSKVAPEIAMVSFSETTE